LEEIAKLEALSGGLLKLAQTGSDLDPTAIKQVAVEELFEDARSRFKHLIDSRDVQVVTKISAKTVLGDQDSLTELVAILLDNAIKYSPKGSTITLASNVDGHSVRLSIKDQGIGMKASDIPHIFDRFYRSDRSRSKDKVDGYGLGLSIAKRIVDVHHGTIMVDSEIDKGSTFRVKLPQQPVRKTSLFS
jgi:two-component system sensor histidine kinase CiaH